MIEHFLLLWTVGSCHFYLPKLGSSHPQWANGDILPFKAISRIE
jgi:hypothetical protein